SARATSAANVDLPTETGPAMATTSAPPGRSRAAARDASTPAASSVDIDCVTGGGRRRRSPVCASPLGAASSPSGPLVRPRLTTTWPQTYSAAVRVPFRGDRRLQRGVAAAIVVAGLVVGAVGCGSSAEGRKGTDLTTVKDQVSKLRLEVENLRQEVASL